MRLAVCRDDCTKAISITAVALQLQPQPVRLATWRLIKTSGFSFSTPITTSIHPSLFKSAECRASSRHRIRSLRESALSKPPVMVQCQQWPLQIMHGRVYLFHVIHYMPLCDEKILPAVVVEILQPHCPNRNSPPSKCPGRSPGSDKLNVPLPSL